MRLPRITSLALAAVATAGLATAGPASADTTHYYVAFGDSLSVGYQPGQGNTTQGYVDDLYVSSFAGFFPADDPRYVVLVVLNKPDSRLLGTVTATDAFKGVAQDILRYARIQPDRRP